jgi:hypothetical protein
MKWTRRSSVTLDRPRGCLTSLAVGDNLVTAVVFNSLDTFAPVIQSPTGGPHHLQHVAIQLHRCNLTRHPGEKSTQRKKRIVTRRAVVSSFGPVVERMTLPPPPRVHLFLIWPARERGKRRHWIQ